MTSTDENEFELPATDDAAGAGALDEVLDAESADGNHVEAVEQVEGAEASAATKKPSKSAATAKQRKPKGKFVALLALVFMAFGGAAGAAWWFLAPGAAHVAGPQTAVVDETPEPPPAFALAIPADQVQITPAGDTMLWQQLPLMAAAVQLQAANSSAPAVVLPRTSGKARLEEVPRHQRWELHYPGGVTIESYARMLDFFGIEIGIIGGGTEVTYLSNLSQPAPSTRTAPAADDARLYTTWQRGSLREADTLLATRAKIATEDKVFAHFYPAKIEEQMAELEKNRGW